MLTQGNNICVARMNSFLASNESFAPPSGRPYIQMFDWHKKSVLVNVRLPTQRLQES